MNGHHQLVLFVVLFGGFLAWGLYEYFFPRTFYMRKLSDAEIKEFQRLWTDAVCHSMNVQQVFIRPTAGMSWSTYTEIVREHEIRRRMDEAWYGADPAAPGEDKTVVSYGNRNVKQ